ncbi:MLP-like protein 28 [Durio zibethinus]|uniref:MLP-like protein 28 n=1 Tax=Durio zibethinus TaxID=66656 RepID=A0A6P6BH54_DURZI|nr:MLP-like protein 28 [Durio zibethinus]
MSSLIGKVETDVELKASAEKFHDMFCNRPHRISNASSDKVQACSLHEGDWGKEGSIICWNYVHGWEAKVLKEIVESVDPKNNSLCLRAIEGDLLKEYKNFLIKLQVSPKSNGQGSIAHWTMEYEKLHEGIAHLETLLELAVQVSKDVDSHLLPRQIQVKQPEMSSLIGKVETDVELKASAEKFHDMFCNRPHHISNASSDKVQACSLHEGDWGKEGSIICWNYVHDGEAKVLKEIVESVDPKNNSLCLRAIEGDLLKEYKSFLIKLQVSPKSNGQGSIAHWTMEYEKLHEGIAHPETLLELAVQVSKDVDSHLIQGN